MWVTPRSSARWMVRIDSESSTAPSLVYVPAMVMAPRPMRETLRAPRCAFFMVLFSGVSRSDVYQSRRAAAGVGVPGYGVNPRDSLNERAAEKLVTVPRAAPRVLEVDRTGRGVPAR